MYVKVRVTANAKKESVSALSDTHVNVSVKEPAKQHLANRRVVALIALHFHTPLHKVRIISGHHSPSKILSVDKN